MGSSGLLRPLQPIPQRPMGRRATVLPQQAGGVREESAHLRCSHLQEHIAHIGYKPSELQNKVSWKGFMI